MKEKQLGVVLLSTVSIISVLSVIIISSMQSILLHAQWNNQAVIRHHLFYQLESVATKLSVSPGDRHCMVSNPDPNQVIDLLKHKHGCLLVQNGQEYRYLLSDLGLFPCVRILLNERSYSSHHWLVTVLSMQSFAAVLQLRTATPAGGDRCDLSELSQIKSGLLSWRYIKTH